MKIEFKSSNLFYKTTVIFIIGFILSSCIRLHHNKFGKEYNDTRIKIKLPIIKNEWTLKEIIALDGKKLQIGAKNQATWFTNDKKERNSIPFHAYKTIDYIGDTILAECDTYLNMDFMWFKDSAQINDSTDILYNTFKKYHALNIIYIYNPLYIKDKDISPYALGFNYTIQGEKDGFSDIQILNSKQAEEILKRWNLKRLNY